MKYIPLISLPLATLGCLIPLSAQAQITPDDSLGDESSVVAPDNINGVPSDRIDGGATRGTGLFHSFQDFNVDAGRGAYFTNPTGINNIFSRVTGTNVSNINGVLGVVGGNANLFLINPNGIIFGQNARLDLGGSFFASTADGLLFEGDTEFSASNPTAPPLLEVNIPIGARFRDNPGAINSQAAALQVQLGRNITLLGGNIQLDDGIISAPDGNIELGGLTQAGEVSLNNDGTLLFPNEINRGNLFLTNSAIINVSGSGRGSIVINAENVEISGESVVAGGIFPDFGILNDQEPVGNIMINANRNLSINDSTLVNAVTENSFGNVGDIHLNADVLTLTNETAINSGTFGTGNGGNIVFNANNIVLDRSLIGNVVGENAVGNAGDIAITTDSLTAINGANLNTSSLGEGNAGNIQINAKNTVRIAGAGEPLSTPVIFNGLNIDRNVTTIGSQVGLGGIGEGGNIEIIAERLLVENGAAINAANAGDGQAGNITLTIGGDFLIRGVTPVRFNNNIDFNLFSSIQTSTGVGGLLELDSRGQAGDIQITAGTLTMRDNSIIASSTQTKGNAGNISIQTPTFVSLDNSAIESGVLPGAEGNGGNINLQTGILNLTAGAQIETLVNAKFFNTPGGIGQGGNIIINATESVNISGFSTEQALLLNLFNPFESQLIGLESSGLLVSTQTGATGKAGTITVNTDSLNLTDSGVIEAFTANDSDGGDIEINSNTVNATGGGQILASTFNGGRAGNILINSDRSINLRGSDPSFAERLAQNPDAITNQGADSGVFANTTVDSLGNGGNINIITQQLTIADRAKISVNSEGQGNGGNISIQTNLFNLDQASVSASTLAGEGGNLTLQTSDLLLMRNNSSISARANNNANGGNADIDARFVIAFPNQNNDITANAEQGNGGNINITTQAIFGLEERRATPPNQTNDIDASSEFGLQGDFTLNTPDFDPTTGLINLPASVGDASDQISQNPCQQGLGSQFIVTGKGGLPPNVNESLNSESARVGLIEPVASTSRGAGEAEEAGGNLSTEALPAQGWVFNDQGEVTLTAYKTTNTEIKRSPQTTNSSCSALSNGNQ